MFLSKFIIRSRRLSYTIMAKSKFEYVKSFECDDKLLPNCWIVVRIDGKSFHTFSEKHMFSKPNDRRSLDLMNRAAAKVMEQFKDIVISYGESDEYSFVLRKDTDIFNRRNFKIVTYITSLFSSSYVFYWPQFFKEVKLLYPPLFDGRIVLFPTDQNLRDYLSWRQVDCHINNLYNTTFWALVQKGGLKRSEAEKRLCGTFTADKNEILFSEFGINYNNELEIFKKGTMLIKKKVKCEDEFSRICIVPFHKDIISESFWNSHWEILSTNSIQDYIYDPNEDIPDLVKNQLLPYTGQNKHRNG